MKLEIKLPATTRKYPKLHINPKLYNFNPVNPKLAIETKNPYMKIKEKNET
jgi:hypothetical protein